MIAPEFEEPNGIAIDAILFGGRRKTTVPLVYESRDWTHGTFIGATLSSETTAAATGQVGVVRRDPMAMLPFIGYHAGDYMQHWLDIGAKADASKLPRIFGVNWFRRDEEDGSYLWPGFGENSRVLKWVVDRLEGEADAVSTPIGLVPTPDSLDVDGLDMTAEKVAKARRRQRRGLAQRAAAHRGVVRGLRRAAADRAARRARRAALPPRRELRPATRPVAGGDRRGRRTRHPCGVGSFVVPEQPPARRVPVTE